MHKRTLDDTLAAIQALHQSASKQLQEDQDRDASAVRADLSDIDDRINALEAKRDSMVKLLEHTHKEQMAAINDTFNAMFKFETERKDALTGRLAAMTGEEKKTNTKRKVMKAPKEGSSGSYVEPVQEPDMRTVSELTEA